MMNNILFTQTCKCILVVCIVVIFGSSVAGYVQIPLFDLFTSTRLVIFQDLLFRSYIF